jgi:hypothetical protein
MNGQPRKKIIVLFFLGITAFLSACESGEEDATIYLRESKGNIPSCTLSKDQDCSHIDPSSVLAVFRFPEKYLSRKRDIDSYVPWFKLQLSVNPQGVSEVINFDGGVLAPYGHVFIRGLLFRGWSIQDDMNWKMHNSWRDAKYRIVESDLNGATKYDEETCVKLGIGRNTSREHIKQGVDETVVRTCFIYSPQYYRWASYPDAFVACQRRDQWGDLVVLMPCRITTLVFGEVTAEYSIKAEKVRDGSWIETDKQIKQFILNHLIARD